MKIHRALFSCALAAVLAGCPQPNVQPQRAKPPRLAAPQSSATVTAAAAASVQLSPDSVSSTLTAVEGEVLGISLSGELTGTAQAPVFFQVTDSRALFWTGDFVQASKGRRYSLAFAPASPLQVGRYQGQLTLQACADRDCATPYAGAEHRLTYDITVVALEDWSTFQRNPRHDGYVPIRLQPARFTKAWEWQRPMNGNYNAINAPVTSDGAVVVSEDDYDSTPWLYVFEGSTGALRWKRQFSDLHPDLGQATISDGTLYVSATAAENSRLHAMRLSDGQSLFSAPFQASDNALAPTVSGGRVCINGGMSTGTVYTYSLDGTTQWTASGGTTDLQSCASDGTALYVHNGTGLHVFDLASGVRTARIRTTHDGIYGSYFGAPIVGRSGRMVAYNGSVASTRRSSSDAADGSRQLVGFSLQAGLLDWGSLRQYDNVAALAKGVIYAGSNASGTLDALDETTGQILWSVAVPEASPAFRHNVVVTENIVLFSTDFALYAVDLSTRKVVWSAPTPGNLAISRDRLMFVSTGGLHSDGRLVAYRLR